MYLGLDLGTSELKAVLLNAQHTVVATAHAPLTVSRPLPLHAEQDPAHWWRAVEEAMAELGTHHAAALAQVRGIGLSGQMHGAVLLDARGQVLRPAILWNDGRSAAECAALEAAVPHLRTLAGNLAMPGFTAPKLLWVRRHEPEVFARVAQVLLPKDWLRRQLTGRAVSDCSDAAGTLWLDVGSRDWSDELLRATGLTRAHMPALVEGSASSGTLLPELARRWGLPEGVVLAGGAGDNAASAIGMGLVAPGQGFVSLGTSGVIFVTTDRFMPNPDQGMHAFCHALPGMWHQMSVMLSAAGAVTWACRAFGFQNEAALLAAAAELPVAERTAAPLFLPYLSGERTPHNNPALQAHLTGLTHAHDARHIAWAVVEGVCFGLRDGLDTLRLPEGQRPRSLSLVGGGARSPWWGQLLANILETPLTLHAGGEAGAALGAARLGWLAAGGTLAEACPVPAIRTTYTPDPATYPAHAARLAAFRRDLP